MCGLFGYVSNSQIGGFDELKKRFELVKIRGTYSEISGNKKEFFGYSRLCTDGKNNLPLDEICRHGTDKLLYNGIIYNVKELCNEFNLSEKALKLDAWCLSEGLKNFGASFLEKINGMFAFAFISKEGIMLGRDLYGIKPLYYVIGKDSFAFSSEIKALVGLGDIKEVRGGELVKYCKGKVVSSRFKYKASFDLQEMKQKTFEDRVEFLRLKLELFIGSSTKKYLQENPKKEVAVLLGGLDSTILLKFLQDCLNDQEKKRIKCYCVGIKTSQDAIFAKEMALLLGFSFTLIRPFSLEKSIELIPSIIYDIETSDERSVYVALLQKAIAQCLRKDGIEVAISGEGADECYLGYLEMFEKELKKMYLNEIRRLHEKFLLELFPQTLLQRLDRVFMRNGPIEIRVPYLIQEIAACRFLFLPEELVKNGQSKWPLRAIARKIGLPDNVCIFPKRPFFISGYPSKIFGSMINKKFGMSQNDYFAKIYKAGF